MVDYTRSGGCLAVVPESHKFSRSPRPNEDALDGPDANNERFRQLANLNVILGWQEEGPSYLNIVDGDENHLKAGNTSNYGSGWHA